MAEAPAAPVRALSSTRNSRPDLEALAAFALRYVKPGQTLGLGTGHAASAFIRALAQSGIKVRGVPTSNASESLARSLGLEVINLADAGKIDLDFDGADEVDARLNLVKGYGGALVREKVIASAARRLIILVGAEKRVRRLGEHGWLPVEIVPFAAPFVMKRIAQLGLKPRIRMTDQGRDFLSDNGNLVLDCATGAIGNASRLDRDLLAIPGVVGTGLFVGIANVVLMAAPDGTVKALKRRVDRRR